MAMTIASTIKLGIKLGAIKLTEDGGSLSRGNSKKEIDKLYSVSKTASKTN